MDARLLRMSGDVTGVELCEAVLTSTKLKFHFLTETWLYNRPRAVRVSVFGRTLAFIFVSSQCSKRDNLLLSLRLCCLIHLRVCKVSRRFLALLLFDQNFFKLELLLIQLHVPRVLANRQKFVNLTLSAIYSFNFAITSLLFLSSFSIPNFAALSSFIACFSTFVFFFSSYNSFASEFDP